MPEIRATYRLQLHAGFGFRDAAAICGYLKTLGVSHVYCSPYLQAAPGSKHGYDIVNPTKVNDELGGEEGHREFLARLKENGLGQVLDIVPNHMAIGRSNAWWWDVLENGPSSAYASYFDVGWQSAEEKLRNKILAPVLGDHYGKVLTAGQIRLEREAGTFLFHYFDHSFPASPESMAPLLSEAAERAQSDYLGFLADSLARLPVIGEGDPAAATSRHRDKEVIRGLLSRLCSESADIARAIDQRIGEVNGDEDILDTLLENQHYRLSFWRAAAQDLGYRRFFDINTLVGLRMELPHVFDETHRLPVEWARAGIVDGLRVDHPDGLRDPQGYFERLHKAAPRAWVVAEKILESDEELRSSWKVAGTTGYDFLNLVSGLFVDPRGEEALTRFYQEFTGETQSWMEVALNSKELVIRENLGSDLNRLTAMFLDICERHRDNRDFTRHEIHQAIRQVATCFPVYRTYVRAERGERSDEDARRTEVALALARQRRPDINPDLIDFIRSILLLEKRGLLESEFVMQFQQFTGPAMAKGVEDTAFYNFNRLVSLNEVGGDPGKFGTSAAEFHTWCERVSRDWPNTMLASATHDTKRGEDVRTRIALLSGIPELWSSTVLRWSARNERYKSNGFPDRNTEYLLYQTLAGTWPITVERLKTYMQKAVREAKRHTSWTRQNDEFEKAVEVFVEALLADREFLADAEAFITPLIAPSRVLSLAQVLLKLTAPGVPDTYQGTEIWDTSLVDPDNRRPVDFTLRHELLQSLKHMSVDDVTQHQDEGLPKLWVVSTALKLRDKLGEYARLSIEGDSAEDALGYVRGQCAVIVPRFPIETTAWGDTGVRLPENRYWINELTGDKLLGGRILLAELFRRFPVAILTGF